MKKSLCPQESRRKRGFLLLDSIIAIFIGISVFMAILGLLIAGVTASKAAEQNTIASNCARQVLENIRLRRNANIPDGTYSDARYFGSVPQLSQLSNSGASVSVVSQGPIKVINITVAWKSYGSLTSRKSRVYTGWITARGVSL